MTMIERQMCRDTGARSIPPGIEITSLVVQYGEVPAVRGVSFSVAQGELVTLLGPSGCGKTTTLRSIAGLERPHGGTIRLGGLPVYDAATRTNIPAEKRGVSMVFQSYAIWPHMTVAQNVAYGLKVRGVSKAETATAVDHALGLVQMRAFADRSATQLSGGQQQRVAVARAIAFKPQVLLFDEPLSNLDAKLRAEMRVELRELQQRLSITALYVTHDQEEALAISDRVIVMHSGKIEQQGAPETLYNRPESRFVVDFVGSANLIEGKARRGPGDMVTFETSEGATLGLRCAQPACGNETTLALRSAYIGLHPMDVVRDASINMIEGRIERRMFHGDFVQYIVACRAGRLVVRRPPTELFDEGVDVILSFAPEHTLLLCEPV